MPRFVLIFLCLFFQTMLKGQDSTWDRIGKEFLLGKINYSKDTLFQKIPATISTKENAYLLKEVYDSLQKMIDAAHKAGIEFKVISASRNFDQQKAIWEKKWMARKGQYPKGLDRAKNILLYSSMPGTSRHHWGTDLDLNALDPKYFTQGKGQEEYDWLCRNAERYGFYQPYDANTDRSGYQEEKWHWSFFPIAQQLTAQYLEKIQYTDLALFQGSEFAKELNVIQHYVNGIQQPPTKKN